MTYYYYTDSANLPRGPVSLDQLQALATSGAIDADSLFVPVGADQWLPITILIPTVVPAPRYEPLAIWGFVLSLCSVIGCGFFLGIPGIVCAHLARKKIRENPRLLGKEFALVALIVGYIMTVLSLLYVGGIITLAILEATTAHHP